MSDTALPARAADRHTQASRGLVLVALIGLIGLGLAWELWWAPTGSGTLALKVLPLMPCVLGVWRYRLRTYRVLSLLVWLYFTEGVVRFSSEGGLGQTLAGVEVALALLLFTACVWQIRWRLKAAA